MKALPRHPGPIIAAMSFGSLMTVTNAAQVLGISRQALNNVISGRSAVSPEMAAKLSKAFGRRPENYLAMQFVYDCEYANKFAKKLKIERHTP